MESAQSPDALAGDIAFNDQNNFAIHTGNEGDLLQTPGGQYFNDIEGLLLHEIGHALGLGHSNITTGVMCGFPTTAAILRTSIVCLIRMTSTASSTSNGPTPVSLPAAAWLFGSGVVALAAFARRRMSV